MNNIQLEEDARNFAVEKHKNQFDDSGLHYICHVEQVVSILRKVTKNSIVIAAAYLHDTVEDTSTTYEELCSKFGNEVADLVMEVTHDGSKDEIGYYFPRLHSQNGIMIKFADRLSNLSRMEPWTQERRDHYLKKSKFWKSSPVRTKKELV